MKMANVLVLVVMTVAFLLPNAAFAARFWYDGLLRSQQEIWNQTQQENAAVVEQYNFTQKLDHFNNADTRSFQQLAYIRKDLYKPGGPIFILLGGEGPATFFLRFVTQGSMAEMYAPALNAMIILLEHRYYGQSQPNPDISVENLQFLNAEQALADVANFIVQTNAQFQFNPNTTRWITFGLSYSASLSAWMRLKYPHLVYAAVASSAPVQAVVEFPGYLDVVVDTFNANDKQKPPGACVAAIHDATSKIVQLLQSNNTNDHVRLQKLFNLCTVPDSSTTNAQDIETFYEFVLGTLGDQVQLNHVPGYDVAADCSRYLENTTLSDDPLVRLVAFINGTSERQIFFSNNCTDIAYKHVFHNLANTTWQPNGGSVGRTWFWQTCHELGYYETSSVFATKLTLDYWLGICADIFPGNDFSLPTMQQRINWTNTVYGGNSALVEWNRVIFVNGAADPWHVLSVLQNGGSKDFAAIVIPGQSHCADALPASATDSVELQEARHTIQNQLIFWLS